MNRVDGASARRDLDLSFDVVVVGSGPAGTAAARELARAGVDVAVVEAGPWVSPDAFPKSAFAAMATTYRAMGASVVVGTAPIPFVQGRMVGGGSPINGAICWQLPKRVYRQWVEADPSLAEALPWELLSELSDEIETRLNVAPTEAAIAGRKNSLMARGAEALGLQHRPIRRNVRDCEGLGRCLQGCPAGRKLSVDRTLLQDALASGATVLSSVEVMRVDQLRGRATGVQGQALGGGGVRLRARRAVVLAASAIQTPVLLLRSGIAHGPVGHNLQCHPGVSMAGRFAEPVRMWEGATQGHEVTGLRDEGLKFESLGFGLSILAARLDGVGSRLAAGIADMDHWLDWGAAVKARATGRVRLLGGRTVVNYQPTAQDVVQFRRGLRVLGEMMFAAGAEQVSPGVKGFAERLRKADELARLEGQGPRNAAAFTVAVTHLFGTCRMGSEPQRNVVRPDFRHHQLARLYVADSSVFPTNLGVNPQIAIMVMAALCARRIIETSSKPLTKKEVSEPKGGRLMPGAPHICLDDLLAMNGRQLQEVMNSGYPIDHHALADSQYLGVALNMPWPLEHVLWKTFRKTFYNDLDSAVIRGWNVRMKQRGIEGEQLPMTGWGGKPICFGHYQLRPAAGLRFPRGWHGADYLDYGVAGNRRFDPARFGYAPLVAVNEGDHELLLGWEVFRVGPVNLPLPFYFALRYAGPLEQIEPVPCPVD